MGDFNVGLNTGPGEKAMSLQQQKTVERTGERMQEIKDKERETQERILAARRERATGPREAGMGGILDVKG